MPKFDKAVQYALDRLENELAGDLHYHNVHHTIHGVMPSALRLAKLSNIDEDETRLLKVAAAFHDLGFIYHREGHEISSARIAAQILPNYSFESSQIERIMAIILATRLPQNPYNLLEQILADADLDVLGREDYFERNRLLEEELHTYGQTYSGEEWTREQLRFLTHHTYFTEAARRTRDLGKQKNIAALKQMLSQYTEPRP